MTNLEALRLQYGQTVKIQVNEHTPRAVMEIFFGAVPSVDVENVLTGYYALSQFPETDRCFSKDTFRKIYLDNTSIPAVEVAKALAQDLIALGLTVTLEEATYKPTLEFVAVNL